MLMTVEQLRGYIPDTAEDDATLEQRIADTEAELTDRFGALAPGGSGEEDIAEVTETVYAYGRSELHLSQAPFEVLAVTDTYGTTDTELEEADFEIARGSYLARLKGYRWGSKTVVRYVPKDARASRRRVLVKLIQLDLNFEPGLGSQGAGPWNESYGEKYDSARQSIMDTLAPAEELFA